MGRVVSLYSVYLERLCWYTLRMFEHHSTDWATNYSRYHHDTQKKTNAVNHMDELCAIFADGTNIALMFTVHRIKFYPNKVWCSFGMYRRATLNRAHTEYIKQIWPKTDKICLCFFFVDEILSSFWISSDFAAILLDFSPQKRITNLSITHIFCMFVCWCACLLRLLELYVLWTHFYFTPFLWLHYLSSESFDFFIYFFLSLLSCCLHWSQHDHCFSILMALFVTQIAIFFISYFLRGHHSIALNKVRVHFYAFVYLLSHCYSSFRCLCTACRLCVCTQAQMTSLNGSLSLIELRVPVYTVRCTRSIRYVHFPNFCTLFIHSRPTSHTIKSFVFLSEMHY